MHTSTKKTKLRTSTSRPSRRTHVLLNERADRHLGKAIVLYTQILERPVSTSLIVRRALAVLAEQLGGLRTKAQKETEAAALALSVAQ